MKLQIDGDVRLIGLRFKDITPPEDVKDAMEKEMNAERK